MLYSLYTNREYNMINVFYRNEQTANVNVFSPSPRKPKLVVDAWIKKFGDQIEIKSFDPVTREQLYAVHNKNYVDGVLNCTEPNGFGTYHKEVADSLPYTSGSLLAAAKNALETGVAVAPVSGMHHATVSSGGGFCTFEGLVVTAVSLLNTKLAKRVSICDNDAHYGNGTVDCIKHLKLESKIKHFTAGAKYHNPNQADDFLRRLPGIIRSMKDTDVLLYQAGGDQFIDDPLGSGFLTMEQLKIRDRIVFETCKEIGLPVAFVLAGGYTQPVSVLIQIHVNTMDECLKVYG